MVCSMGRGDVAKMPLVTCWCLVGADVDWIRRGDKSHTVNNVAICRVTDKTGKESHDCVGWALRRTVVFWPDEQRVADLCCVGLDSYTST